MIEEKLKILSNENGKLSRRNFLIGLVGAPILLSNCSSAEKKLREEKIKSIYSRGIDNEYLKKFMGLDLKKSFGDKNKEYFKEVEETEEDMAFIPRTPCDIEDLSGKDKKIHKKINNIIMSFESECNGIRPVELMYSMAMENLKIIRSVDSVSIDQLGTEYKSLKILLNDLHEIDLKNSNPHKKLEKIYNSISDKVGDRYKRVRTILPIQINKVIDMRAGECDDISSMYFSLLNYFNIPCYFKMGRVLERGEPDKLHAWPSLDIENYSIDIDPTWYDKFVPLKDTNLERIIFKKKFMLDKSHRLKLKSSDKIYNGKTIRDIK